MDLTKVPNERKLYLCKWYFKAGLALLPFVWAVNTVWFFNEAFRKPVYDEQKEIKKYVILSAIGTLFWAIAIGTWVTIFQLYRASWGEFADNISFMIPVGMA
ncbi:presenilin enhancer [Carabus blaptoides fortunei]